MANQWGKRRSCSDADGESADRLKVRDMTPVRASLVRAEKLPEKAPLTGRNHALAYEVSRQRITDEFASARDARP